VTINDIFQLISLVRSEFIVTQRRYAESMTDSTPKEVELPYIKEMTKLRLLLDSLEVELAKKASTDLAPAVKALLNSGQKIEAVKLVKNLLNCILMDAKQLVDSIGEKNEN
jgi:ribosomal protein L7/L12